MINTKETYPFVIKLDAINITAFFTSTILVAVIILGIVESVS